MRSLEERWKKDKLDFEVLTPCVECKHRITGLTCAAYPGGIPQMILIGAEQHRTPLPGDHGIQFEQI